jgi:glutathione S-transferase
MKLYFAPGACSLSPHIALREAGLPFSLEQVDILTGKTASGESFAAINPKGYVPALKLDDGSVLTEGAAIVQYIADLAPSAGLAPRPATLERARLQEWLNFLASELHKAFSPLFRPDTDETGRRDARTAIAKRLSYVEAQLADGRSYLLGNAFSAADIYLFVIAGWAEGKALPLSTWPRLKALLERVAARDSVREALSAERLAA